MTSEYVESSTNRLTHLIELIDWLDKVVKDKNRTGWTQITYYNKAKRLLNDINIHNETIDALQSVLFSNLLISKKELDLKELFITYTKKYLSIVDTKIFEIIHILRYESYVYIKDN